MPTGGLEQGATFEGRLNLAVDLDFDKLAGWKGLTAHANIFAIHGDGLSRTNLNNFFVVSGIEAFPTVRLYEAYVEQKFLHDKWSIRAGQLAADSEFIASKYTDVFTNASLGWPAITAVNLPAGGPSPPLAAVGARLSAKLNDNVTVLARYFRWRFRRARPRRSTAAQPLRLKFPRQRSAAGARGNAIRLEGHRCR